MPQNGGACMCVVWDCMYTDVHISINALIKLITVGSAWVNKIPNA